MLPIFNNKILASYYDCRTRQRESHEYGKSAHKKVKHHLKRAVNISPREPMCTG